MKKDTDLNVILVLAVLIFLSVLLLGYEQCFAATDTLEGQAFTDDSTIEGVSTTDMIEGQDIKTGAVACAKDTDPGNKIMDQSSMSTDRELAQSTDASGQSISYGSAWKLWSIEIDMGASTSVNCEMTVRIGTGKDLSTYMEQWTGITPGAGAGLVELISVDQDSYGASTTYYIGIYEDTNSCYVRQDDSSPPYTDGLDVLKGTGWSMGVDDSSRDKHIDVYQTTDANCE